MDKPIENVCEYCQKSWKVLGARSHQGKTIPGHIKSLIEDNDRLVSENERLREALGDFLRVCAPGAFICHDADVIDNARKALERKQP